MFPGLVHWKHVTVVKNTFCPQEGTSTLILLSRSCECAKKFWTGNGADKGERVFTWNPHGCAEWVLHKWKMFVCLWELEENSNQPALGQVIQCGFWLSLIPVTSCQWSAYPALKMQNKTQSFMLWHILSFGGSVLIISLTCEYSCEPTATAHCSKPSTSSSSIIRASPEEPLRNHRTVTQKKSYKEGERRRRKKEKKERGGRRGYRGRQEKKEGGGGNLAAENSKARVSSFYFSVFTLWVYLAFCWMLFLLEAIWKLFVRQWDEAILKGYSVGGVVWFFYVQVNIQSQNLSQAPIVLAICEAQKTGIPTCWSRCTASGCFTGVPAMV